jgi:SHS2 domain-containing protein
VTPRFELFDHTADLGVRVRAPSMPQLVAPATAGFYAAIGEVHAADGPGTAWHCESAADEPALLLRDYLAELLALLDCEQRCIAAPRVHEFAAGRLVVAATAHPIDPARSLLLREVKAVTYHELALRPVPGGFELTFIVDI